MPDVKAKANFDKMELNLSIDGKKIKTFDLTVGDKEPSYTGFFKYKPEGADKKLKYNILFEFLKNGKLISRPKLYIYPMYDPHVIIEDPIDVSMDGKYEDK